MPSVQRKAKGLRAVVQAGAQPAWKLVYVYQPLSGPAEILRFADLDLAEPTAPLSPD